MRHRPVESRWWPPSFAPEESPAHRSSTPSQSSPAIGLSMTPTGIRTETTPYRSAKARRSRSPIIVAYMLQTLQLISGQHVLEIGAGCGYQTALLARLGVSVAAMEIRRGLAEAARVRLQALNVEGVDLRIGDGSQGWPEDRRFDAILVAAAARDVPAKLARQLATPGRLILPVGSWQQELVLVSKDEGGMTQRTLAPVRFVPLQTP